MATRRVKRIKRTKKQVHRARGRKTSRRCRRYTRRQRGGRKFTVCEKSGFDFFGTSKGIAISYDDETQKYTIGNESYKILLTMPRYENALNIVRESFPQVLKDDYPVELDIDQFETFKKKYCSGFADIGGKEQCETIRNFRPPVASAASVAPVTAASATDTNSNNILITKAGVKFRGKEQPWSQLSTCAFDVNEGPFTQCVFTANRTPPSVSVKYVMSNDAKTFCALAKYANDDDSRMHNFTIDYSLISPSVTIILPARQVEPWDIKDDFELAYIRILRFYNSCEEPYTGSYDFYQEENPIIAALFFTKPPEMVYDPIVYKRVIQKRITECVNQIKLNMNLFKQNEVLTIVSMLEHFKKTLNEMKENPILEDLKKLDNEVNDYVRVTFQRLVQTKKKDQYQSLDSKISTMSLGASAAVP